MIAVEPGVCGWVFESFCADAGESMLASMSASAAAVSDVELRRVKVREPPQRLVFEWRNINFAPVEKTKVEVEVEVEVEVQFMPSPSGTRIAVIHRGWNQLSCNHPVRHGLPISEFISMMARGWGDQLTALRGFSTP